MAGKGNGRSLHSSGDRQDGGVDVELAHLVNMHSYEDTRIDLSPFYRAWERHYAAMGLAANKLRKCVQRKVDARKMPR